jgi:capsular exopolysaccharide synthesis family protein
MSATPDPAQRTLVLDQGVLDSDFADAYRALWVNIGLSTIDEPVKTIAVTSAGRGEGRTVTVVNLGIVMAQAGHVVVVVDADLRRPALDEILSARASRPASAVSGAGFSGVIAGFASARQVMQPTSFDRLSFVPAGPAPANAIDVLGSNRVPSVLAELAELADYVLIDTPPCLVYPDALLIARAADGVVHVVKPGGRNKAAQRQAQRQLQQARARVLGIVMNDMADVQFRVPYGSYHPNGHRSVH